MLNGLDLSSSRRDLKNALNFKEISRIRQNFFLLARYKTTWALVV